MHSNLINKLESVKLEMYFYVSALTMIFKKLVMILKQLLRSNYIPHQDVYFPVCVPLPNSVYVF